MPQSDNHNYNVPNKGEANWHQPLNQNFRAFDIDIELRDTDGNKSNYTPKSDAKLLATDTGLVYEGDGSNWNPKLAQYRYAEPASSGAAGNLVAGHESNNVGSGVSAATIAGGGTSSNPNEVTAASSTVGGGKGNRVTGSQSVIAGGVGNAVSGLQSVVVGGNANAASGGNAAVGGGAGNRASGTMSTVPGGDGNEASGDYAAVGGGQDNTASAQHATVAGGNGCSATAANAFAAGTNASADHEGAFVWSDTSSGGLSSVNPDEFAVSAAGGVFLYTNSSATTGVELPSGSGSWSSASSRTLKSNLDPVDPAGVLERVRDLEISTWHYDAEGEDVRHMGPMAEDFADAFGLGDDEETISTVDADGVAFAAIQGLAERLVDHQETVAAQRDRIEELEAEREDREDRLAAIEAELGLDGAPDGRAPADD
jgi:hypothetical protein